MPLPTEIHIIFLGLATHPDFKSHQRLLLDYMENLRLFTQKFYAERWKLNIRAHFYNPGDFVPKTYEQLLEWDREAWPNTHFGRDLQFYIGYGIDLRPHEKEMQYPPYNGNPAGYCECYQFGEQLRPEDMMYADMEALHPVARNPYEWWANSGVLFTHENEHQIMRLLKLPGHISAVHKARSLPRVRWDMRFTDSRGNPVVFWSQGDPRKV